MGDLAYVRDVIRSCPGQYVVDLSEIRTKTTDDRYCYVTEEVFRRLSDYTNSCPTAPSSGRVYKKDLAWKRLSGVTEWMPELAKYGYSEARPHDWWVFFVRNGSWVEHEERQYGQLHHPFHLVVLNDQVLRRKRALVSV